MRAPDFKTVRLQKGWSQTKVAARLNVSQPFVNMLENGKRSLTPEWVRRLCLLYGLPPESLPVPQEFVPREFDDQTLVESLARLEYPGFSYVKTRSPVKNPSEVLLTALTQQKLDARVAEALPWVVLKFWSVDTNWLVEQACKDTVQNRLGFVVSLARQISEHSPLNNDRTAVLRSLEDTLGKKRLVGPDYFYRPPLTDGEKEWLLQNRSEQAVHWNLLSDMKPEHLQYVR